MINSSLTSKFSNFKLPEGRILVAPLNWGLGHATRCIPIIRKLLENGNEVVIAADGHPLALLKQEFPQLIFIELPGYDIRYPANGNMPLAMLRQLPKIIGRIRKEHKILDKIIIDKKITSVISDNRYGLWSNKVPCFFITHQVMVKCPSLLKFLEPVIYRVNTAFIKKYHQCWIPDFAEENNLSGDLAHLYRLPKNAVFIGPLSRFEGMVAQTPADDFETLAVVSGPEPQRSIFEKELLQQLKAEGRKSILVRGLPGNNESIQDGCVRIVTHFNAQEMLNYMSKATTIISRAGYSTIMDLAAIGKKATLIPTPGQTEQEYLASINN